MGTTPRSRRPAPGSKLAVIALATLGATAGLLAAGRSAAQVPQDVPRKAAGPAAAPKVEVVPPPPVGLAPQGPGVAPGLGVGAGRASSSFRPDDSYTAETLLRNAERQVAQAQWPEAIDLYQRVMREHGDSLALVPSDGDRPAGSSLYVDARRYCQSRLAALPPEARALYRKRVDDEAGALFARGDRDGDPEPLRRVVEEYFCSNWGDDAAERLGDLAFRDGRFAEALASYGLLVPERPDAADALVHPDPSVDLAGVAAKVLLCRAAAGDPPDEGSLDAYRRAYPKAEGHLAGRDGPLADLVAEALARDHLAPPAMLDGRWPTFAGAASRSRVAPEAVEIGDFGWAVPLDDPSRAPGARPGPAEARLGPPPPASDAAPPFYPIIVGDQVVISDGSEITALRLDERPTGVPKPPPPADGGGGEGTPGDAREPTLLERLTVWRQPPEGSARRARGTGGPAYHTLTAQGDRVFARLSAPLGRTGGNGGTLVAMRNTPEVEGKLLWYRSAGEIALPSRGAGPNDRGQAVYEGTPVADDGRVYVALSESSTETWVYVAALEAETGRTAWVTYLGGAASSRDLMRNTPLGSPPGHRLLSLDGRSVYYQTNMGAVAALDAETGEVRWLATYPTPDVRNGGPAVRRGLNPAVVHEGLVLVAPEDTQEILAFDADDGRLAWKSQPLPDVVHLLGVARGHLFATGRHRVYTLDAKTGRVERAWPDAGLGYEGYGRGILAGDRVYWPTRTEIHVLDQATGGNEHATIPLFQAFGRGGGNLAVGDGYLVVAGADELAVYCQNTRLIERLQERIAEHPDRPAEHYQLARLAESAGRDELALSSLERAEALAGGADLVDGRPLAEAARSRRYNLLVKLAARAAEAAEWDLALERLGQAVGGSRTEREEVQARLALAEAEERSGRVAEAVAELQGLLGRPGLEALTLAADARRTVRADGLVADRLVGLVARHGREAYARYDREAEALLRRGRDAKDPRALREVGRSYPAAEAAPEAMLALGRLGEETGRPAEAASAYRRLLAIAAEPPLRARALWGLAASYQAMGYLGPARDTYAQALARYPEVELTPFGIEGKVSELAAARLAGPGLAGLVGGRAEPEVPVPLVRRATARFEPEVRPIAADGYPASPRAARVFAARGSALLPIDPDDGSSAWSADLGSEPRWAGYLGDRLLAATATRLVALDAASGREAWGFDPRGPRPSSNPFARPGAVPGVEPEEPPTSATLGMLTGFRLVGPRVVFLRGDREILALDAESGRLDWSYSPAAGRIDRHVLVTPSRVVLQAGEPRALVVLDTETGRLRGEFPRDPVEPAWERDPVALDDDHAAVALDPRRVALIDLERGAEVWTYRDDAALPTQVSPLLLADSGCLLAVFGGNRLARLDPANGRPLWERPLGPGDLSAAPGAFALDAARVYVARASEGGGELSAYALDRGERAWTRHLVGPEAGWRVALGARCVAAYPDPDRAAEGPLDSLPVLLCRRDSGEPVQRLLFAAPVRELAVRLDPLATLVATQGRLWSLGPPTPTAERSP
jgi:outer membrane protein assembly factor BamB/tetratricopeptide (TPR) repeat protein